MTKKDIFEWLSCGMWLSDLLPFTQGQDCQIYKAPEFKVGNELLYIPDFDLNNVVTDRALTKMEIGELWTNMYSGDDFISVCDGNVKTAEFLFNWVD